MARFFDITLMHEGAPIEPKSPVQVEISYVQGLYSSEFTAPGVVHYLSDEKLEIIENVNTSVIHNEVTSFRYEQNSFSPVGTYIEQEIENSYATANPAPVLSAVKDTKEQNVLLNDTMIEEIILKNTEGQLRDGQTEQPYTKDHTELSKPTGNKTLTANQDENGVKDGTYTLTLSVKGHSNVSSDTVVKKSNVLVVMDRSSSMISKTVNNEETRWYYGTKNTSIFRPDISASQGYQFYGIVNGVEVPLNVSADWNGNVTITYQSGTWMGRPTYTNYPGDAPIYVVSKKTRMMAEQEALGELYAQLLDKNNASGQTNDDIIEVAVISFGDQSFDKKSWSNETECGWTKGRDVSPLNTVTSSNRFTSGTNWEEALEYAYETINAKKAQDGTNENYYVIFLTDGEPTAVRGDTGAAHTTDPVTGRITKGKGNIYAYNEAKDEAKKLVDNGYKFYNIFTYRTTEDPKYSVYLTNYAYGNGNENGSTTTDAVQKYYTDAQTIDSLKNAFNNIFTLVENSIGHGNVSITDTLTTDAMTTTVVQGKTNGYVYTVKNAAGETLYTVTAAGDIGNPAVTFHVPGSATKDYTASVSEVGGKKVYSIMTAEGRTYKMALADINDQTGELVWDLSSVGILMNECTYNVSFVVWPDQDAYDYVAALNNGLPGYTWSTSASTYEDLTSTKGYAKGGVEQFPSIVKYPNDTFAVLTNTDQKLHYSVIETTSDGTNTQTNVTGPFYKDLPLPEPMPLTASASQIEKVWNVERDPGILAQLLYNPDGTAKGFSIPFEILQKDGNENKHYTDVTLGWDDTAKKYIWDEDSRQTVNYNGNEVEIGTHWASDFSIATGLMISQNRAEAIGLDQTAYPSAVYNNVTYYILEEGHDYTIEEPELTYEFDFSAPVYHPMLVDGVLSNVAITKSGNTYSITSINNIASDQSGVSSLVIENTLRGYIHLNKVVVDSNGTQLPQDNTKFTYTVTLTNRNPVFEGDHIPWYGINGLFYHDADFNYYQAEPLTEPGTLSLKDESGNVYTAACAGTFNPDIIGPTQVTYTDPDGNTRTIQLYGNQLTASEGNTKASAELRINQNEILNIANVPVNTVYTITETQAAGYLLDSVIRQVGDGTPENLNSLTVEGTITANTDTNITYKNKSVVTDVSIQKTDESGNGLAGAVFQLRRVNEQGIETLASDTEGIRGLITITKQVNGETKTYESAFESTGSAHTIAHLPEGTYRLYEVLVPVGYISTYKYIQFEVADRTVTNVTTDTGNTDKFSFEAASGTGLNAEPALIKIVNEAGAELPHTGGMGTMSYTCIGMIMILSAGILYVLRRRKAQIIS